jgi:putative transcriptional regulator
MSKKYRSEALASIHETIKALHEIGAINRRTMRGFDETCLMPVPELAPAVIRETRERDRVS